MSELWLARHGATEWSLDGRHTGTTDLPLLPAGEQAATALAPRLRDTPFALVITSPMLRARRTAELAGFPDAEVDDDLAEWGYGAYEGVTTADIRLADPGWTIWEGETPGGEAPTSVAARLDRVVDRARAGAGPVLAFGHGHCLRALTARWLGLPVREGRLFRLDTSTLSVLGAERDQPCIVSWNS